MKKKSVITTPHDAIFRHHLSRLETARDFMELHLPDHLKSVCDLNTLKLESGSYIEEDLRQYYSDVLYSLKTAQGEGYIHVLIEHQSSPDRNMAFRLMRYAMAVMQRHLDEGHTQLPLVIPLLFYHGRSSPYPWSLNWQDAFSDPSLARRLYSSAFPLVDVTVIPDDEIMNHRSMAMLTLLQKHIRERDLTNLLERLVTLLVSGYTDEQQLTALLNYMLLAGEARNPGALIATLAKRVPEHEGMLMTIAEKLREEGRLEGLRLGELRGERKGERKGERRGEEKGRAEAKIEVARSLLAMAIPLPVIVQATGLSEEQIRSMIS